MVLRQRAARAHAAAPPGHAARHSRSTARCSPTPEPAARRRGIRAVPVVAHRRGRDRRGRSRRRASSRSCASPRACCARCTCSSWRPTSRRETRPAHRARARAAAARRAEKMPRYTYWPRAAAVLRARPLRRAAAPLPATLFARRADAGADLRRLPSRTTRRRCARCCASSRSTTSVELEHSEANPTVVARSAGAHRLVHALAVGRGPLSRADEASCSSRSCPVRLRRDAVRSAQSSGSCSARRARPRRS